MVMAWLDERFFWQGPVHRQSQRRHVPLDELKSEPELNEATVSTLNSHWLKT
jgi:hypothetical protein